MARESDPSSHQSAERRIIEHVMSLLGDPRLVVDTKLGRRAVTAFEKKSQRSDHAVDVKRAMTELNVPDRALQSRLPVGEDLDVMLQQRRLMVLRRNVGQLRVICISPTRDLILGESGNELGAKDVQAKLNEIEPANVPQTIVLVSTSGFTNDARRLAERTASRTVILAEPNSAGGWTVSAPPECKALGDVLNPEQADERASRVREEIEAGKVDLLTAGLSCEKLAAKLQLPLNIVETEIKSYARQNRGLIAKRIDGRVILFREGTTPTQGVSSGSAFSAGGFAMPMIDKIKALFSRKGETEKKIAFLSERRAALSQQRERAYEEITALEAKDDELVTQFKSARAPLTKRRVTGQLLQLRKDIERRQQMITVLNQQVNVVSTHLHNLELTQQGQVAELPDSEEIAADAAAAEEMIAQLQADTELADSVAGIAASAGMSDEEQALYEELEKESGGAVKGLSTSASAESTPEKAQPPSPAKPQAAPERRAEPEAG